MITTRRDPSSRTMVRATTVLPEPEPPAMPIRMRRDIPVWKANSVRGGRTIPRPCGKLARTYRFKDFADAFAFMTACALRIQALDHHPEWSNVYSTVKVELVTHDAGGITARDVELAGIMEGVAGRFGAT